MVVCSSTQSCFIVTLSLCVASPLDSPQLRRSSGRILCFRDPQKRLKKNVLGPIRFGACFLAVPLSAGPIFVAFCELKIRYVLGPRVFLCFLGPSFLFFEGVKNLILGCGEKECGKCNERFVVRSHDDGRQLGHSHFQCRHT